jgi:hypothetical protein
MVGLEGRSTHPKIVLVSNNRIMVQEEGNKRTAMLAGRD